MVSNKNDEDLIARVVRELEATDEPFTFDLVQSELDPGPGVPPAVVKRVLQAFGPGAVMALAAIVDDRHSLRVHGDERVFWVARLEQVIPVGREEVAIFGDGAWRTIPSGAAAWQAILASLPLRLDDDDEVDSVLRAFEAFGATVLRNVDAARQIAAPPTDDEATWRLPPEPGSPEIVDQFEPPHREGRHQVFCANVGFHQETRAPACVRVVVDIDTLASTVTWLCKGRSRGQRFVLRGRALVDQGVALTAAVRASGMDAAMTTTASTVTAWQEAAAAEHASIASFARATLELMAVGAPLSLVARTGQAAADEVRHARLSLAVARRLAGDDHALTTLDANDINNGDDGDDDDDEALRPPPGGRTAGGVALTRGDDDAPRGRSPRDPRGLRRRRRRATLSTRRRPRRPRWDPQRRDPSRGPRLGHRRLVRRCRRRRSRRRRGPCRAADATDRERFRRRQR